MDFGGHSKQDGHDLRKTTGAALRKLRFQNLMDNALSRGFVSLIAAFFALTLIVIIIASGTYLLVAHDGEMDIAEAFWTALAFTTNPELPAFSDVSSAVPYMLVTLAVVIVGLFVTSALVGIITTSLTNYYESLQRGFSSVLEEGHIAILGFSDSVQTIIHEFEEAHGGNDDGEGKDPYIRSAEPDSALDPLGGIVRIDMVVDIRVIADDPLDSVLVRCHKPLFFCVQDSNIWRISLILH